MFVRQAGSGHLPSKNFEAAYCPRKGASAASIACLSDSISCDGYGTCLSLSSEIRGSPLTSAEVLVEAAEIEL
jgi:hypothetical protein